MHPDAKAALGTFAIVAVLVAAFVQIDVELAYVGHLGSAMVAITLLYAPVVAGWRRGQDLGHYGFHAAPVGRGLVLGLGIPLLVIFPLFTFGYMGFFEVVCPSEALRQLAVPGSCNRYNGFAGLSWPVLDLELAEFALVQLVVVALPEELFFRGFMLGLLERALPPRRRLLGGGIGWALVISAAAFALIHIPRDGDPRALATFFPGLMFGWMRSATGSILAPTLAHAGSNILIRILDQVVLR